MNMLKKLFRLKTNEVKKLEGEIEKIKREIEFIRGRNKIVYETGCTSKYIPVGAKYTELFELMDRLHRLKKVS